MSNDSPANEHRSDAPKSLHIAIITVSDTRTLDTDKSGSLLVDRLAAAGHTIQSREIVLDEPDQIRSSVQSRSANEVDAIILTGGTGISPRDQTPEAICPLLEVELPGFGELFRMLSYEEIGPASMLSRAFAGRIGKTLVFGLPGSTGAVRLALDKLLIPELPHLLHHSRG